VSALAGESIAGDWTLTATDSYEGDDGVINSWSLAGEVLIPDRTILGSASPNLEITSGKTTVSSIELNSPGEVSPDELEVLIDVSHTYRGDLQIQIETPAGTIIPLKQTDDTDSSDNVVGVFPDSLVPVTAFSALAGESLAGEWTLRISDAYNGDDGTLNNWSIRQRQFVFPGSAAASPVIIEGLTNDSTYSCDITSVLSSSGSPLKGETVDVGTVSPSVSLELPSVPIITSTDYEDGKIILAVSVSDNGGTDITGYEAICTDGANSYTGTSASSPITVSGLTNGVAYTCTVTATNSVGTSAASASTASIVPSPKPPRVVLEEPLMDETHTGVGNLRGWAISSDGIDKVEIYIDDAYALDAPYGGVRTDVGAAFPDVEGSENSGFSLAFNYSNLSSGTHTVSAIAHSDAGATKASAADFEVVRFASSFISDPNAVDLSLGSCSLASDEVTLANVTVDGSQHDLVMKWRRAEQGFELIQIEKSDDETAEASPVALSAQQSNLVAQSDPVLRVVLEEPILEEIHTGVGNLRGWAVADEGIEKVEIYIDGAYSFDAPYGGVRTDVRDAFPDVEGSENSGFSLAFNYSNLSLGPHTIAAVAHNGLGVTKESSADFNVVRFDSSFISDLNAVDLSEGSCSLGTDEVSLTDVTVDGSLHDLVMKWRRAEQGFEIVEIR
jgi:subtilisin-like proprotein convertase family protein